MGAIVLADPDRLDWPDCARKQKLKLTGYRSDGLLSAAARQQDRYGTVILNDEGIAFFGNLTTGRRGIELPLRKANGDRWGKSKQTRPPAEACEGAKIVPPANLHSLRHTYASHAVMAGAPLLVVAEATRLGCIPDMRIWYPTRYPILDISCIGCRVPSRLSSRL